MKARVLVFIGLLCSVLTLSALAATKATPTTSGGDDGLCPICRIIIGH